MNNSDDIDGEYSEFDNEDEEENDEYESELDFVLTKNGSK